jgi:hypothetical protein
MNLLVEVGGKIQSHDISQSTHVKELLEKVL